MDKNKIIVNESVSDLEFQGITIAPKKSIETVQQITQEVQPHTGTATRKPNGSSDNPQKATVDQTKPSLDQNKPNQEEVKTLWQSLSKLQKGLLITTIVLSAIGLVVGLTILGCSLAWKPLVTSTSSGTLNIPGSKQGLNIKDVNIYDKNVIYPSVRATVQVDTIYGASTLQQPTTRRMLQQQQQEKKQPPIAFFTIFDENKGITLKAENPSTFTVEIDFDRALLYYSKTYVAQSKRLLQYAEMRLLQQQSVVSNSNSLHFDESPTLRADAEDSIIKGVANAFDQKTQNLVVEYSETAQGQLNSEGLYVLDTDPTPQTSSRLLYALQKLRMLGQLKIVFQDINNKVVEPEILRSLNVIRNYGDQIAKQAQVTFDNGELLIAAEEVTANSRLLQDTSTSTTPTNTPSVPTTPPASTSNDSPSSNTPTTPKDSNSPPSADDKTNPTNSSNSNKSQPQKSKLRRLKPIPGRRRLRDKDDTRKTRVINEQTRNASMKCTGPKHRRRCNVEEFNSTTSPHKTKKFVQKDVQKKGKYTIRVDPDKAKKRRERREKQKQEREKNAKDKTDTPPNNNPTAPTNPPTPNNNPTPNIPVNPSNPPVPTNSPSTPSNPSTPTTPTNPSAPINPSSPSTPSNQPNPASGPSSPTTPSTPTPAVVQNQNQGAANNGGISP